ncbi:hypothetical protein EON64_16175 [archaeon]|nr:MAG: hypothetical protein EON64_16175 [archaeon]
MSSLPLGIYTVWYLYMLHTLHQSPGSIGVYLAVQGALSALVQALVPPLLLPRLLCEAQASALGLLLQAIQLLAGGLVPEFYWLYIVSVLTAPGQLADPALRGLLSKVAMKTSGARTSAGAGSTTQGRLQGCVWGLRTLGLALGSLLFPCLYSLQPSWLAFAVAAAMYVSAAMCMGILAIWCDGISDGSCSAEDLQHPLLLSPHVIQTGDRIDPCDEGP